MEASRAADRQPRSRVSLWLERVLVQGWQCQAALSCLEFVQSEASWRSLGVPARGLAEHAAPTPSVRQSRLCLSHLAQASGLPVPQRAELGRVWGRRGWALGLLWVSWVPQPWSFSGPPGTPGSFGSLHSGVPFPIPVNFTWLRLWCLVLVSALTPVFSFFLSPPCLSLSVHPSAPAPGSASASRLSSD